MTKGIAMVFAGPMRLTKCEITTCYSSPDADEPHMYHLRVEYSVSNDLDSARSTIDYYRNTLTECVEVLRMMPSSGRLPMDHSL